MKWLALSLLLLPQGEPTPFAQALQALRAGEYEAAQRSFAEQLARGDADPALRSNLALAALARQRTADAEAAARPLLAQTDPRERCEGEFLLGMAALQRGEQAALAAALPDAEPMAWRAAILAGERALQAFLAAAQRPDGWPAALRNAERSWLRLQAWQRASAAQANQSRREPTPPPQPKSSGELAEQLPEVTMPPMTQADLQALREKLLAKDREKRAQRSARQVPAGGERGW